MKRCPTCNRTYEDTLTYCLMDGSVLSAPFDPKATFVIPQQNPTVPAAIPSAKSSRLLWIILACAALLISATIAVIALVNRNSNSSESGSNVARQDKSKTNEPNTNNRNDNSKTAITEKTPENKNSEDANPQPTVETPTEGLSYLQKYVGKYPYEMFKKEEGLKQRLRNLLGANYKLFMDRWDVAGEIEKHGDVLFAEGCMAHSCTVEESLLAIDTSRGIIYCAIMSDSLGGKFKTFSEANGSPPPVMKDRMKEIEGMK